MLVALVFVAGAMYVPRPVRAQQGPTFKSGTGAIVSLFATVMEADKRLVPDLQQDDFEIFDNDKPQPTAIFDNSIRPITVVVLLDTSGSMTGNLDRLRDACEQFLIRLLPKDKAQVGAFNDRVQIAGDFTSNRDLLIKQVRGLDYGNGTRLYDAINTGIDDLKGIEGRRVIVVFTDGDDTASHAHFGTVQRSGTGRRRDDLRDRISRANTSTARGWSAASPTAACRRLRKKPAAATSS